MGNCCRPAASSMEWGGEDWDYLRSNNKNTRTKTRSNKVFDEGQGLISLGNAHKEKLLLGALRASCDADGKVKIRISKKELKELLGGSTGIIDQKHEREEIMNKKKRLGRASAEQVLLRLLKAKRDHHDDHTPWKPVLESIPELN